MSIKIQVRNNRAFFSAEERCSLMMQKCPKYGKNLSLLIHLEWWGGELQEPWWPTCHSPSLLFLTKAFFSPSSLPPSLLLAWGAACGPPDAYRQMSLVEQNTLCLTSQAATGLWRKLKGCLPCKDHSIKARPLVLSWSLSYPPPWKLLVQQDTVGSFSVCRRNICHFWEMLLFFQAS